MTDSKIQLQTYSEQAYLDLRRRILGGQIAPGTKLTVRILADQLGLSPTPIKSALVALEREGFIVSSAHRGFSVPETNMQDIANAFDLLEVLDVHAGERVVANPDRDSALTEIRRCVAAQSEGGTAEATGWELDFHHLLWRASGNPRLVATADNLRGLVLIATGGELNSPERNPAVHADHALILEALEAGDGPTLERLQRAHMRETARTVRARLASSDGAASATSATNATNATG